MRTDTTLNTEMLNIAARSLGLAGTVAHTNSHLQFL